MSKQGDIVFLFSFLITIIMIDPENITETIDAYLHGRLDFEQLGEFEKLLREDDNLRAEVEAQQLVIKTVRHNAHTEFRNRLKEIHREMIAEQDHVPVNSMRITSIKSFSALKFWKYGVAAGVVLLIAATIVVLRNRDALFETNAEQAAVSIQPRVFRIPLLILEEKPAAASQHGSPARSEGEEWKRNKISANSNTGNANQDISMDTAVSGNIAAKKEAITFTDQLTDSLIVLFDASAGYSLHYQFTDTLKIYSTHINTQESRIAVEYDKHTDEYTLMVDTARYPIEKGLKNIRPLQPPGKKQR